MHPISQHQEQQQLPEQQQTYLSMRMPIRQQHHAHQRYVQHHHQHPHQQHQHQQLVRGNTSVSSDRDYAGPPAHHHDRRKTAHDLSDDGETSSAASEDSTASFSRPASAKRVSSNGPPTNKRGAAPSAAFTLPPSQRPRTTFHVARQQQQEITAASSSQQAAGCLPVSSSRGGTFFERGTGQQQQTQQQQQEQQQQLQQQQQQRQLPRLAALETLLSSHAQQQEQGSQTWQHGGLPTTRLLKTNGAAPMRLGQQQTLPSISRSVAASSSASSSPTCSPGLRSTSPPRNLQHQHQRQQSSGRYQPPRPVCIQGSPKGTDVSAALINHEQKHWLPPASASSGSNTTELRRQVPRINALSTNSENNTSAHGTQRQQPWRTTAPAAVAVASWPNPAGGSGDKRVFRQETTVPYNNAAGYGYRYEGGVEEERGSNWPRQQHQHQQTHGVSARWSPQQRQQHVKVIQHPSDTAPKSAAVLVSSSSSSSPPSSRTPSPVSISSFRQGQQQQQLRHHTQAAAGTLPSTAPASAPSPSSPERGGRDEVSWTPPVVVVDDAGQRRGAASSVHNAADGGGRGGKWDEEAQAQASGSVGKQILQQYLTHLYPKASREVWSHDEEEVLWRAQKEYGNAWSYISSLLPGRSENAVKNHWYTQMRMFIGQRGNNASKPCPPPTSKGGTVAKTVGSKAGGSMSSSNRQTRRKVDDFKSDALKQPQRCATASPPPTTASAVTTLSSVASPAPSCCSTTPPADPEPVAKAVDDSAFDNEKEESQARADAVAALGMLFSQGNGAGADR